LEFKGQAENSAGEARQVEGRAVPQDATRGKLKVRVFVSKRIQLIFNTTYRFVGRP
jgi:lipocalin